MKKITRLVSFAAVATLLLYCKPSKKSVATAPVPAPAPTAPVAVDSAALIQMEIVQRRWPNSTVADVREGQGIYITRCGTCHQVYDITLFNEFKWLHEIDDMSPKANLTAEEKLKLTKYILSYRETKERLRRR